MQTTQTSKRLLTNSLMNTWLACPRKYKHRYVDRLVPTSRSAALNFGSIIHEALERWHLSQDRDWSFQVIDKRYENLLYEPLVDETAILTERAVARAMLHGYICCYPTDSFKTLFVEAEFRVDIRSAIRRHRHKHFDLAGKVDAVVIEDGVYWLMEHKTSSSLTDSFFHKLAIDPQITTYIHGVQRSEDLPITGVIYNVLRKPSKRRKKGQSLEDFEQEMHQDYESRPEFYFRREYATRNEQELAEFEARLRHIANQLKNPRLFPRNGALACGQYGGCAYMPLCIEYSPEMAGTYETTEDLHPELSDQLKGVEPKCQEESLW